jgi:hypothetical protein
MYSTFRQSKIYLDPEMSFLHQSSGFYITVLPDSNVRGFAVCCSASKLPHFFQPIRAIKLDLVAQSE